MIWAVDAVWMLVAMTLATAGFLAAGGVGRGPRAGLVLAALAVLAIARVYASTTVVWNGWLIGGGSVAVIAAACGPARYATTVVLLVALPCALAGLRGCPVGLWGLLHHLALVDVAGACAAMCVLGIQKTAGAPRGAPAIEPATPAPSTTPFAPPRLARRAGVMLVLLCLILAWALVRQPRLFEMPDLIGLSAGASEALAAAVAWRVIHGWVSSVDSPRGRDWGYRLGLFVAGLSAVTALILVPVVISAARDLSPSLSS